MAEQHIKIPASAGGGDGWGGSLLLRSDYPENLVVDLTDVNFVVPLFLVRLRTFVDWHTAKGRTVKVIPPSDTSVGRYMARMRVHTNAPAGCFVSLPKVKEHDRHEALLPVTCATCDTEAEEVLADLVPILWDYADAAGIPDAVHMAMAELSDNSLDHGENPYGMYMAIQRYPKNKSLRLAVSDLGPGIPGHLRRENPEWGDDAKAIEMALQPGVTGTGESNRGNGLDWTLTELEQAPFIAASINIRSGAGRCRIRVPFEGDRVVTAKNAGFKKGTMISLEFTTR